MKIFMYIIASLACLLIFNNISYAGDKEEDYVEEQVERCIEHDSSTVGMLKCMSMLEDFWDKRLNMNYRKAKAACIDDNCRNKLIQSERTWLKYMNETVEYIYAQDIGSLQRLKAKSFIIEAKKRQAKFLEPDD